jgi:hypothetical protein
MVQVTKFLDAALAVEAPTTWRGCEYRVQWCLHNLTKGEKAYLYRVLHTGEGFRIDRCHDDEREQRTAMKTAQEET